MGDLCSSTFIMYIVKCTMKYKKGTYFFLIMINKIIIAIIIVMANKHPNITTRTTVSKLLEVSPEIKFIKRSTK